MKKINKGLGDSIESALKATGVDKVAKKILGDDCGCKERKDWLNRAFPYINEMTEHEQEVYLSIRKIAEETNIVTKEQQIILIQMHNRIFKAAKKPTNCSACVRDTLIKLKKVYDAQCETKNNKKEIK